MMSPAKNRMSLRLSSAGSIRLLINGPVVLFAALTIAASAMYRSTTQLSNFRPSHTHAYARTVGTPGGYEEVLFQGSWVAAGDRDRGRGRNEHAIPVRSTAPTVRLNHGCHVGMTGSRTVAT